MTFQSLPAIRAVSFGSLCRFGGLIPSEIRTSVSHPIPCSAPTACSVCPLTQAPMVELGEGGGGPAGAFHTCSTAASCCSCNVGAIIILSWFLLACWLIADAPYLVLQRPL